MKIRLELAGTLYHITGDPAAHMLQVQRRFWWRVPKFLGHLWVPRYVTRHRTSCVNNNALRLLEVRARMGKC